MIFSSKSLNTSRRCLLDSLHNFNLNHFLLSGNLAGSSRQTTSFHPVYLMLSIRDSTSLCICYILWRAFSILTSSV
ncbi:hypothetical protein EG68_11614 [Paragonimus skrjabini miyazakii]|uniref:Uncharacterized protein n=1 Tax=Paragonimus skrjabini miyazakii TaxID=59628 RepID=A0A8S9YGA7_9TREM|nr:hypothetical protein EG68_11614 [Paragonimus skrjabini miyazakii]